MNRKPEATFTCPWWLLFTFDNPLRHLVHHPKTIVGPYIRPGDTVLDVGCGMGYFTLEMAQRVGASGKVIAADIQPQMLAGLQRRAERAALYSRIRLQLCRPISTGVTDPLDFALAFWMVHEVRNREAFLSEIHGLLKPGGRFLIIEPVIHVTKANFTRTVDLCQKLGLRELDRPRVAASRAILFQKS